jgi:adenosylcobyric acid synthase
MKALGVLGTASGVGKSWITIALCAWLRRQSVRVAPFKAQNMSNNAWATLDGREMARAQAVQAEACGLLPSVEMNPILIKPTAEHRSQLILQGVAQGHLEAQEYYRDHDRLWRIVADTLDGWRERGDTDVLVLEGAGSPVELNLMVRDVVNLRPLRHLDGRFVLVGDIDRGGIYAQLAGTWNLLPPEDRARSLGAIVNRFRGDLALFPDPSSWLTPHAPGLPVLGTVPLRRDLQPEEEDGLTASDEDRGTGDTIAWIRFPHAANLTDCQPWWTDTGIRTRWTSDAEVIATAKVIVLPGSKNTIADLRWLRAQGLDRVIQSAAARGTLIIGLCGGYQMLGESLSDPAGLAGDKGEEPGLSLLPVVTTFAAQKIVRQVTAECETRRWTAYEIHMGRTEPTAPIDPLHHVFDTSISPPTSSVPRPEGIRRGNIWATYLHGWFESLEIRQQVARAANITTHRAHPTPWADQRQSLYTQMADHLAAHIDLNAVRQYLGL